MHAWKTAAEFLEALRIIAVDSDGGPGLFRHCLTQLAGSGLVPGQRPVAVSAHLMTTGPYTAP